MKTLFVFVSERKTLLDQFPLSGCSVDMCVGYCPDYKLVQVGPAHYGGIIHKMVVLAVQENCHSLSVSKPASRVPQEYLFQTPT